MYLTPSISIPLMKEKCEEKMWGTNFVWGKKVVGFPERGNSGERSSIFTNLWDDLDVWNPTPLPVASWKNASLDSLLWFYNIFGALVWFLIYCYYMAWKKAMRLLCRCRTSIPALYSSKYSESWLCQNFLPVVFLVFDY